MGKSIEFLKNAVYKGAKGKKVVLTGVALDRINRELSVIEKNEFTDHFLLYSRIAEVCNELKLIRSPGRGNSINSIVNYCLDITKVNPVAENLWFESFMYQGQRSLPDMDIDVPFGTREKVIETLKHRHPEYNMYKIAISKESNTPIHPCGIIITNNKLDNNIFEYQGQDLYHPPDVHHDPIYNNNKVDILELTYLNRLQFIAAQVGENHHPYKLPLDDIQVFDFFASGDLENIFLFSSPKLSQHLVENKPNSINELATAYSKLMERPATSASFAHALSYTILSYWGCYYKTYFRQQFETAFSKELTQY